MNYYYSVPGRVTTLPVNPIFITEYSIHTCMYSVYARSTTRQDVNETLPEARGMIHPAPTPTYLPTYTNQDRRKRKGGMMGSPIRSITWRSGIIIVTLH